MIFANADCFTMSLSFKSATNLLSATVKYEPKMHIVLHQPEIPPNTGAVGRTCVALGAKLWLVRPLGFQMDEKALRRAGLDYWQYLEWEIANTWNELLQQFEQDQRFFFFSRFGNTEYTDIQFFNGDCLVFGSETAGLPRSITEANPEKLVRIPTEPNVRSLNLASSVAVAGFEASRQLKLN